MSLKDWAKNDKDAPRECKACEGAGHVRVNGKLTEKPCRPCKGTGLAFGGRP